MIQSLKDLNYGNKIVKFSLPQVIWHWFKYVLGIGICGLVIGICALVYFTPQIPKFLSDKLPEVSLSIKDGQVSTNMIEPFIWGDKSMALIINTKGTVDDLKEYRSGVLILKDKLVAKNDKETKLIDLSDFKEELTLSKSVIITWTQNNKFWLLGVGVLMLIMLEIVLGGVFLVWQSIAFVVWSLGFWIFAIFFRKKLGFLNTLKIVIYASVLPLLLSTINMLFQDKMLDTLGLGLQVFYAGVWIYHLDLTKSR